MKRTTNDRIRILCLPLAPAGYMALRVMSPAVVPWLAWALYFLSLTVVACGLVASVSMLIRRNPPWLRGVAFLFLLANGALFLGLLEMLVI